MRDSPLHFVDAALPVGNQVFPRNRGFPFLSDLGLVFDDHATVTGDLLRICLLAPMAAKNYRLGLQRQSQTVDPEPEVCGEVGSADPVLGSAFLVRRPTLKSRAPIARMAIP